MIWFGLVLRHINHCRLFNVKFSLSLSLYIYIYILKYVIWLPKALALLVSHHQIVQCHFQDTFLAAIMQSMYSTALADWAVHTFEKNVFYNKDLFLKKERLYLKKKRRIMICSSLLNANVSFLLKYWEMIKSIYTTVIIFLHDHMFFLFCFVLVFFLWIDKKSLQLNRNVFPWLLFWIYHLFLS